MTNERLAVSPQRGLEEVRNLDYQPQNKLIRALATVFSYLFHPLFVPVWMIWFLLHYKPDFFASFSSSDKVIVLIRFAVIYTMFPLVTVLLLKMLGFLRSIHLRTQRERIIPYISTNIYYFWMAYVLRNQPEFAPEVTRFAMAIFIASSVGLMLNSWTKISMHAISMGLALALVSLLSIHTPGFTIYVSIALLLTGLVCTARLIVSDHTPGEIYLGLLVGIGSMFFAVWVDGILP